MTRPATITQVDIKRAVKGARDAGIDVARVEVVGGKIVIVAKGADGARENEWDEVCG